VSHWNRQFTLEPQILGTDEFGELVKSLAVCYQDDVAPMSNGANAEESIPWEREEKHSGRTPRKGKSTSAPMDGARSEREFRVSANERLFNDKWGELVKKWGQQVECSRGRLAVPFYRLEEYMLGFIAGTKTSNKQTTLNRVLDRLQSRGELFAATDESGTQWLWR
jgi:hypothetical protein